MLDILSREAVTGNLFVFRITRDAAPFKADPQDASPTLTIAKRSAYEEIALDVCRAKRQSPEMEQIVNTLSQLTFSPDVARDYQHTALLLVTRGERKLALAFARRAAEDDPEPYLPDMLLVSAYLADGEQEKAAAIVADLATPAVAFEGELIALMNAAVSGSRAAALASYERIASMGQGRLARPILKAARIMPCDCW